jgi:hypothetical protein
VLAGLVSGSALAVFCTSEVCGFALAIFWSEAAVEGVLPDVAGTEIRLRVACQIKFRLIQLRF